MIDINLIVKYFEKLQKIILHESDFTLGNKRFIKKTKIDDILCCIIGTLPDEYKSNKSSKFSSIRTFKNLYNQLHQKFPLAPNYYMINFDQVNLTLVQIRKTLINDIETMERLNSNVDF